MLTVLNKIGQHWKLQINVFKVKNKQQIENNSPFKQKLQLLHPNFLC